MVGQLRLSFTHGFFFHVDRVCVVDHAVEYGVGQDGIADRGVPWVDGQLAGGDRGAAVVAVFEAQFLVSLLSMPKYISPVVVYHSFQQ